jgi:serine/threonine protein kinase
VSPLQLMQRQASAALAEAAYRGDVVHEDGYFPHARSAGSGSNGARTSSSSQSTSAAQATAGSDPSGSSPCFGVVAIKQIIDHSCVNRLVSTQFREHYLRKVCREVEILLHFNGIPQIINLCDLYLSRNELDVYLVMPYMEHNLRQVVQAYPLEEPLVRWIICQVLLGLRAIHHSGVIHRDLTLANLLVDGSTWDVRIADFGLSRARETVDQDITLDVVTLPYRAPELLLEYPKYSWAIDIWSVGCIMAECLLRTPFLYLSEGQNPDSLKQLKLIFSSLTGFPDLDVVTQAASMRNAKFLRQWHEKLAGNVPQPKDVGDVLRRRQPGLELSNEALDVLRNMLQFSPHDRLSAEQLLSLPWFQQDEACRELIRICIDGQQLPGQFTEYVERLDMAAMQALLMERSNGRRADFDSAVSQQQDG